MIGFGTLARLAKGGIGPDELAAICEAAGMEVDFGEVPREEYRAAFGQAGTSLLCPGAKLMRIEGTTKTGDKLQALIILAPARATLSEPEKMCLTAATA